MNENSKDPYFEVQIKLKPKEAKDVKKIPIDQVDEFGSYETKFPMENFDIDDGHKDLNTLPVTHKTFLNSIETGFSRQIAEWRSIYKAGALLSTISVLSTGYMWRTKHVHLDSMLLATATLLYGTFYFRQLGYGESLNRVNVGTFKILTEEQKKMISKSVDVKQGLKILKEEFKKLE
jgi:phosphosulfolactate synthase (CoM biosynthesis protein A)